MAPMRKPFLALAMMLILSGVAFGMLKFRPVGLDMTQAAQQFLDGLSQDERSQAQ